MAHKKDICWEKPNTTFSTLPTKPTGDKEQGSLKHPLPTSSKY